ncbi:hypothetical protein, partial [Nioella sp. MMSF_3534]|uniref:hypothetical protein n=1 Tax=Nioella sp. MMSF_3534 TaxID=3046720 RepID=UPI00273E043D
MTFLKIKKMRRFHRSELMRWMLGPDSIFERLERLGKKLGYVDKWRSQRRIDVMSMKPRKLSAV